MRLTTSSGGEGDDVAPPERSNFICSSKSCDSNTLLFLCNLKGDKFRDVYQIFKLRFEQK
jgi:hypothetical protein